MSMILSVRQPVYTKFGDVNRPTEEQIFMILHLQEMLNQDYLLNELDLEILKAQNEIIELEKEFNIYALCRCFNLTRKRMERRLSRIKYKLLIEYLEEKNVY